MPEPRLTLVIPTRNRPLFLAKLLSYYAQCPYRFVILMGDASDPREYDQNLQIIERYKKELLLVHVKQPATFTLNESTLELLDHVTTPYGVWSGDDDYLVPSNLQRCVGFLDAHSDYNLASWVDAWVYVREISCGSFKVWQIKRGDDRPVVAELPSRRMLEFVVPHVALNYFSVQRAHNMRSNWKAAPLHGGFPIKQDAASAFVARVQE